MELTIKLYESPKKDWNNEHRGEYGLECICCGKPMAKGMVNWVHMNEAWVAVNPAVVTEENCKELTGNNSQGCFPIGTECAKKMKGYTFKMELDRTHPHLLKK